MLFSEDIDYFYSKFISAKMHSYLTKEQRESYLRELFYSSFSDRRASVATRNEETRSLGKHLRKLYNLVEIGKGLSSDAETALKEIIKIRTKGRPGFYETKMMTDYKKLLFFRGQREDMERNIQEQQCFQCIHNKRKLLAVLREDDWYWGTKQQLRCGEIIADTLGGLDPVFAVLLHPAGWYNIYDCYSIIYRNPSRRFFAICLGQGCFTTH